MYQSLQNDKEDLFINKHRLLERLKELSREPAYEAEQPAAVVPVRDNTLHRESRRQQGPCKISFIVLYVCSLELAYPKLNRLKYDSVRGRTPRSLKNRIASFCPFFSESLTFKN